RPTYFPPREDHHVILFEQTPLDLVWAYFVSDCPDRFSISVRRSARQIQNWPHRFRPADSPDPFGKLLSLSWSRPRGAQGQVASRYQGKRFWQTAQRRAGHRSRQFQEERVNRAHHRPRSFGADAAGQDKQASHAGTDRDLAAVD